MIVVSALRDYTLGLAATPAHLTIVPPLATYLGTSTDDGDHLNDGSVGARLQLGTFTMFFTGDGEVEANNHWRTSFADLIHNVTVLKVGHHGANNAIFDDGFSGTSTWLGQVIPQISIVSGNGTSHPRINALARLLAQPGNLTYCTNVHGNITIRISRTGDFALAVARNAGKPCVSGSEATT
jgi:beta-lactamase superfamily II metal-dependent hydrolase